MSTILLDCDGVCADFLGHAINKARLPIKREDVVRWDFISELSDEDRKRTLRLLADSWFWATIPPVEGAREAVDELRQRNKIYVLTSPWMSCPSWGFERRRWVGAALGIDPSDVIITPAKHLVRGDYMIDDNQENVEHWQQVNPEGTGIVFGAPYNQGVADWVSILQYFRVRQG